MKLLYISFLIFAVSCSKKEKTIQKDSFTIDGKWIVKKVGDTIFDIKDLSKNTTEFQPYLIFDTEQNKIGGYSGCNTFTTNAIFEDSKIHVTTNLIATERLCYGTWEKQFFTFIEKISSYQISYDTLFLNSNFDKEIILIKADKFGLNGNWKLSKINGELITSGVKNIPPSKNAFLRIDTDKNQIYSIVEGKYLESDTEFTGNSWKHIQSKSKTFSKIRNPKFLETIISNSDYFVEKDVLFVTADNQKYEFVKLF